MFQLIIGALVLCCASADDAQWFKSVKGGHQGWSPYPHYPGSPDTTIKPEGGYGGYMMRYNMSHYQDGSQQHAGGYGRQDFGEVGVCYVEVPTASLAHDSARVPTGNGSRPDLSRIRTCCQGYERNIEMFLVCDPICKPECINALCTAPNTCSCYPDHIRNLGGFCMPTCPIGCQNGHCNGRECRCKEGYTLDSERKFCKPVCRENCGGMGNCTQPDTCTCRPGYQATREGNCKSMCNDQCRNGECVSPNECRCKQGYRKSQGQCEPECPQGCQNGHCIAPNVCSNPSSSYQQNSHLYPDLHIQNGTNPGQAYYDRMYPGRTYPGQTNPNQRYPGQQLQPNGNVYTQDSTQKHLYPESQGLSGFGQGHSGIQSQTGYQTGYQDQNGYYQTGYQGQNGSYGQSGQQGSAGQAGYYGQRPQYPGQQDSNPNGQYQCSTQCVNGVCTEQNTCRCNEGYVTDASDGSGSRCIPYCPGGCPNGTCSAPNFCICNAGYRKDTSVKGRPACVRRIRRSVHTQTPRRR